jgi:hypothetical protein
MPRLRIATIRFTMSAFVAAGPFQILPELAGSAHHWEVEPSWSHQKTEFIREAKARRLHPVFFSEET